MFAARSQRGSNGKENYSFAQHFFVPPRMDSLPVKIRMEKASGQYQ
jgi:hypothetical protein